MSRSPPEPTPEALRSATWLRFFRIVLRRRLQRSFHAVRLAAPGVPDVSDALPLIVYLNHASWWDGALVPIVLDLLFPARRVFGPIDADALRRYRFMRRLGYFGVERDSYAGAANFLRVGRRLLAERDTLFCLTPEGGFTDPRVRPVRLLPGLASLIAAVPRATVLPMALEYPFWTESTPEALIAFGDATVMGRATPLAAKDLQARLEDDLSRTMDRLARDATTHDPERFDELFVGSAGVGGVYDLGRRMRSWSRGRRFDASHLPRRPADER